MSIGPATVTVYLTVENICFRSHSTDTMKPIAFISLFVAATATYISATCRNFTLDPATEVLSGECSDGQGDNAAWQPTSLDLNTCFAYDTAQGKIVVRGKPQKILWCQANSDIIIVAKQRQLRRSMRWLLRLLGEGPDLGGPAS